MPRTFKKIVIQQPIIILGKKVAFQPVGNNEGILALDDTQDAALIAELDKAADTRRGGVSRISAEIYDELLKKKTDQAPQQPRSSGILQGIRVFKSPSLLREAGGPPKSAVESAGGVMPVSPVSAAAVLSVPQGTVVAPLMPPSFTIPGAVAAAASSPSTPPPAPLAPLATLAASVMSPPANETAPEPKVKRSYKPRAAKRSQVQKHVEAATPQT